MIPIKNILLATDFSPNANSALPYAIVMAKRYDSTIQLFHAMDHEELDALKSGVVFGVNAWIRDKRNDCQVRMEEIAADMTATYGVKFVGVCAPGRPVKSIVEHAHQPGDIIVISTHGRAGISHLMLGSVAERVVRLSDVPVLTVRPGEAPPPDDFKFKTILLPTDFSQNAAAAEPYAVEFAKQGGKILLAHVVDDSIYTASMADPTASGVAAMAEWIKSLESDADRKILETARRLSTEYNITVEPIRVVGRVAKKLSELAVAHAVDLIVVATHGYTGLPRLMMGSVAEEIVQTSPIPVLSIKPSTVIPSQSVRAERLETGAGV